MNALKMFAFNPGKFNAETAGSSETYTRYCKICKERKSTDEFNMAQRYWNRPSIKMICRSCSPAVENQRAEIKGINRLNAIRALYDKAPDRLGHRRVVNRDVIMVRNTHRTILKIRVVCELCSEEQEVELYSWSRGTGGQQCMSCTRRLLCEKKGIKCSDRLVKTKKDRTMLELRRKALAILPWDEDKHVQVLFNSYPGPLGLQEIADFYGVTRQAIAITEYKALKKLRKYCNRHGIQLSDFVGDEINYNVPRAKSSGVVARRSAT